MALFRGVEGTIIHWGDPPWNRVVDWYAVSDISTSTHLCAMFSCWCKRNGFRGKNLQWKLTASSVHTDLMLWRLQ